MKKTLISVVLLSLILLVSQAASAQTIGLRKDLFDSNSLTLDAVLHPEDFLAASSTINYKANSDFYVTFKGAIEKGIGFLNSLLTSSAQLEATYLMNDKVALNFCLSDVGNLYAVGEYLIVNNTKFSLATQLGVGYKPYYALNTSSDLFVGLDLLASYDVLSNLNLSASIGVDYNFNEKYIAIEDKIAVSYAPIKYVNLYLSYGREDYIGVDNNGKINDDALFFNVGTGIKDEYLNANYDIFDRFTNDVTYRYYVNPSYAFNSISLTNNLSLNYNVSLGLYGLLDNVKGIRADELTISAGLRYAASKFDVSFFAATKLSQLFDKIDGINVDIIIALGLGYQMNNSLKAYLNTAAYLDNLSDVEADLVINPGIIYSVNNNLDFKVFYIGDYDFTAKDFESAIGVGLEIKF